MFFTLFFTHFISLWIMNFRLSYNWPCPYLCFWTQKACIQPRWTSLSEELRSPSLPPLFFDSFMSECFFLCWSHVDGSSKALFYFKSCSRWDSFLLDSSDVISRSRVLSLQGDSVVFLLWDYLIFGCNMYDDCRDEWDWKQLAHHNQLCAHT